MSAKHRRSPKLQKLRKTDFKSQLRKRELELAPKKSKPALIYVRIQPQAYQALVSIRVWDSKEYG
jgi:hypothetical protein